MAATDYNSPLDWGAQAIGRPEGCANIDAYRYAHHTNDIYFSAAKVDVELPNFLALAGFIFAITCIRYIVREVIILRLALKLGFRRKKHIEGLQENAWYTGYYVTVMSYGLAIYFNEDWTIRDPFWYKMYYLIELAFYGSHIIALNYEMRKKDHYQMLLHHCATFLLVAMSYWAREHRVGLIVLLIHNTTDIPLYLGKSIHYWGKGTNPASVFAITQTLLAVFAISFFFLRLLFFPLVVIRSSLFDGADIGNMTFWMEENALLSLLVLLHGFWFYLIILVALKTSKSTEVKDVREQDSDDEDDGSDHPNVVEFDAVSAKQDGDKKPKTK